MSWDDELTGIEDRRTLGTSHGGKSAVEKQHSKGKLTVRERINELLDKQTFREYGPMAGGVILDDEGQIESMTPANYVIGYGKINSKQVVIGGEDFTVKGGSPNAAGLRKSVYAEHLALDAKLPLVRLLEGGGGSVASGTADPKVPRTVGSAVHEEPRFAVIANAMGCIPIASAALGPVAGFPAGRLVASHFSVMVKSISQVMVGGPALVKRALGKEISKEALGGYQIHSKSGVVDRVADSEKEAFALIRSFLGYLPQNVWDKAPRLKCTDPIDRCEQSLADIVPKNRRHGYNMRKLVKFVIDENSFFELSQDFGPSLIIGLARINGQPIGITANNNLHLAGSMTAEAAQKMRRLIELCETFHLPIVNFVDEPGFMIGPSAETAATIKFGMAAVAAAHSAKIPWASVRVRKSFGVAAAAHYGANAYILDWPSAESGALPLEGGVAVAFAQDIAQSQNPEQRRAELEAQFEKERSPFRYAESFAVHDMIDPRETRPYLCEWVELIQTKLDTQKGETKFFIRP